EREMIKEQDARKREREMNKDWVEKEQKFHQRQADKRSIIRYEQNRMTNFDELSIIAAMIKVYKTILEYRDKDSVDLEKFKFCLQEKMSVANPIQTIKSIGHIDELEELQQQVDERLRESA